MHLSFRSGNNHTYLITRCTYNAMEKTKRKQDKFSLCPCLCGDRAQNQKNDRN